VSWPGKKTRQKKNEIKIHKSGCLGKKRREEGDLVCWPSRILLDEERSEPEYTTTRLDDAVKYSSQANHGGWSIIIITCS